jgi:hypothetical protein
MSIKKHKKQTKNSKANLNISNVKAIVKEEISKTLKIKKQLQTANFLALDNKQYNKIKDQILTAICKAANDSKDDFGRIMASQIVKTIISKI